MAYTSVIPVRRLDRAVKYVMNKEKTTAVSLQDALDYAANRDKTEQSCFESSYACTLETAFADMRQTKERWHKLGGVQGYHLVQSFAVGEVTPELAHQIAKELTDRVLGGRYEYVIGTHLNTGHIHSHIVWNSVSCVDGKKYHSNGKSYVTQIRTVSDELCRKYKLSVIDTENSNHVAKPYAEWLAEKNGHPTWRTAIRQDVDAAIGQSLTWRQFLSALERKGYEVRMGRKYPVLRPPGKKRFVRFKTLGKRYTPEAIQTRINNVGFWDSIPLWAVTLIGGLLITVLSFTMILTVYGRMFSLWMYAAIAPIPLSTFAGEPTGSVGKNFIRSYAGVCLQGVVIALSCIIFSAISSSPPAVDTSASVVTAVWTYVGELAFNLLVLVGAIKGCDRIVKEIMGL